ncbi:MAG: RNA polymerase sigma factor [Gammaproteobacteria bacterium]
MATSKPSFLGSLFRRHAGELRSFAQRRVGSQEAEDVVQEAFLRLLQHTDVSRVANPRAYLYRVAAAEASDHGVRLQAHANRSEPALDPDLLCSSEPSPESAAESAAELGRCLAALDELPAPNRHVFLLHRLDGLTHADIAKALRIPKRSVERYAAKALAHCLERTGRDRD